MKTRVSGKTVEGCCVDIGVEIYVSPPSPWVVAISAETRQGNDTVFHAIDDEIIIILLYHIDHKKRAMIVSILLNDGVLGSDAT